MGEGAAHKQSWFSSITMRVGLIFYSLVFCLVILLSGMFFSYFRNDVETSLLSSYSIAVNNNAKTVNDFLVRLDMYFDLITDKEGLFLEALLDYDGDMLPAYQSFLRMKNALASNLNIAIGNHIEGSYICFIIDESMPLSEIIAMLPPANMFSFATQNGTVGTGASAASTTIILPNGYEQENWYLAAKEQPGKSIWFTLPKYPEHIFVACRVDTIRVYNAYTSQIEYYDMGTMVLTFRASWIEKMLNVREDSLDYILLDAQEHELYCSKQAFSVHRENFGDAAPTSDANIVSLDGEKFYLWDKDLHSGMKLYTLLPHAEIASLSLGSIEIVLVSAFVLLIIGLFLILVLSTYATKPIRQLAKHMQKGKLERIEKKGRMSREVNWLFDAFNAQIESIKQYIDSIRQSEQKQKKTELKLLQAQINPHFFINTLNTICSNVLLCGDDETADTISDLSEIIRYNLREPLAWVPLAQEMEVIRKYLSITQAQGESAIVFEQLIDERCLDALVPKLLLQPLVENTLSHADSSYPISLQISLVNDQINIFVRNHSGAVHADQINAHLNRSITLASRSTGLGIRNVDMRMKLTYGEKFGLKYVDLPDNILQAELILPYIQQDKNN